MLERDDFQQWRLPKFCSHWLSHYWDGVIKRTSDFLMLCSAIVLKGNPCLQAHLWFNTSPEVSKNHNYCLFGIFIFRNEVGKRSSHRAAKQRGFYYKNTTVIAGGVAIERQITKLPIYRRPEGRNHKKWTKRRTDILMIQLLNKRPGGLKISKLLL